jgi:nitrite reductase/ring-hydroxylating ferredoxin subunit
MPHIDLEISSLALNEPVGVEQGGNKIVVIRTERGVAAFEDVCPHALWPLSGGIVRDGILECPGHCWEFSLETGQCVDVPDYCLKPIPMTMHGKTIRLLSPPTDSPSLISPASSDVSEAQIEASSPCEPAR